MCYMCRNTCNTCITYVLHTYVNYNIFLSKVNGTFFSVQSQCLNDNDVFFVAIVNDRRKILPKINETFFFYPKSMIRFLQSKVNDKDVSCPNLVNDKHV